MSDKLTHWNAGGVDDALRDAYLTAIDNNVYEALKNYASDMVIQFGNSDDPDSVHVLLAQGRSPPEGGTIPDIGYRFRLREQIMESSHDDTPAAKLALAVHLESIAQDLRRHAAEDQDD